MHELQGVGHAVMDFPEQQVLFAQQALVLAQQRLLVAQHLRLDVLALLGPDGHPQRVGQGLQEGNVGVGELTAIGAVDFQHAEGVAVGPDQHIDGAANAMLCEEARCAKARLELEVVGEHRFPGAEGVPGRTLDVVADPGVPDDAGLPAHPRADEECLFVGQALQDLGEARLQAECCDATGLVEDGLQIVGLEGEAAERAARRSGGTVRLVRSAT